jgi:hypothetical protein
MLPQEDTKMSVKGKQNRRKSHQKKLEKKKKCKRNAASRNPHRGVGVTRAQETAWLC